MSYEQYRPTGFRMLPPVVKNILIINGLLFLATIALANTFRIDLADFLGLHYFGASKFYPFQVITYMFMHGGFTHLFFNMFAVWMFGNVLENVWGAKRFIIYYLVTGVGAAVVHYIIMYYHDIAPVLNIVNEYLANPSLDKFIALQSKGFFTASADILNNYNAFVPTYNKLIASDPAQALQATTEFMQQYKMDFLNAPNVIGASGAVFGILLAFGMMFPNSLIYIYFAIPIKAKYFVMLYGAIELYAGITNSQSNVAHWAHLGGMVFGFFLILYWKKKNIYL